MTDYMKEALELAARGRATTAPNPMVGCILVKDGEVIGKGWHRRARGPHAEVYALQEAGESARGATAYVTLEPCSHFGRTPPCADALVKAGVARAHVAMLDPNPLVAGKGVQRLREAGIEVIVGEREAEARRLNEVFVRYITTRRPFVIAKWAMTLDGKIATHRGHARWISGEASREHAHSVRHQTCAILIGRGTALADDPSLTTRLPPGSDIEPQHPLRVVLDSRGLLPLSLRLFDPHLVGQTVVATTNQSTLAWRNALGEQGVEVLCFPQDERGRVDLLPLLEALGERQCSSLLVEGGAVVFGSFFEQKLVNLLHVYVAPKLVGGLDAPGPIAGRGVNKMSEAHQLHWRELEPLGEDWLLVAEVVPAADNQTERSENHHV
jgi:diaminohydroxyphosphoribosylaminopyrimidine deaminase / 5-amino-6-(5-phosphoribosylamino)uracil reductase